MGLLDKRTPEEKEAARVAKEQRKAAEDAARARQLAERQAADAAAAAEYARFVEPLPKWEYKVLTESALAGWDDGTIKSLEPLLNDLASHGWRVITMSFTGQISQALASDKNHLYVVLERPARYGGHYGEPVAVGSAPAAPSPPSHALPPPARPAAPN